MDMECFSTGEPRKMLLASPPGCEAPGHQGHLFVHGRNEKDKIVLHSGGRPEIHAVWYCSRVLYGADRIPSSKRSTP
eukprot:scaffold1588_cov222-Amphora_coffeaeformis.AAC.1